MVGARGTNSFYLQKSKKNGPKREDIIKYDRK